MLVTSPIIYAKRFALSVKLVVADVCGFMLVRCKGIFNKKTEVKREATERCEFSSTCAPEIINQKYLI